MNVITFKDKPKPNMATVCRVPLDYNPEMGNALNLMLLTSKNDFDQTFGRMPQKLREAWIDEGSQAKEHTLAGADGSVLCVVCINFGDDSDGISKTCMLVNLAVRAWFSYKKHNKIPDDISVSFEANQIQHIAQTLLTAYGEVRTPK